MTVGSGELTIVCDLAALAEALQLAIVAGAETTLSLPCPARLTRSGRTLRLVQNNGVIAAATPDASLLRLLGKARTWWAILRTGEVSPTELAERLGVTRSYITRVVRLAFLSPAVTEAILTGRQRAGVTVASLVTEGGIMADWNDQRAAMLPG